jgi:hypothetical protein
LYLSVGEKSALLVELARSIGRLTGIRAEVRAEVLAVADDVALETVAQDQHLGAALRDRWTGIGAAVAAGQVSRKQAAVLVRALDVADDHEARALRAEERRARRATRFSLRPRGDGTTDLYARLPDPVANRLRVYLDAYTSPAACVPPTRCAQIHSKKHLAGLAHTHTASVETGLRVSQACRRNLETAKPGGDPRPRRASSSLSTPVLDPPPGGRCHARGTHSHAAAW